FVMAVQDAETPRGHRQEAGARKKDANELDAQDSAFALEPRGNQVDQQWRGEDADEDDDRDDEGEERRDRAGDPIGLFLIAFGEQSSVDRNKGRRHRAFPEQVLQQIRDAKGGRDGVGGGQAAEEMREDLATNETRQAAGENADRDE